MLFDLKTLFRTICVPFKLPWDDTITTAISPGGLIYPLSYLSTI